MKKRAARGKALLLFMGTLVLVFLTCLPTAYRMPYHETYRYSDFYRQVAASGDIFTVFSGFGVQTAMVLALVCLVKPSRVTAAICGGLLLASAAMVLSLPAAARSFGTFSALTWCIVAGQIALGLFGVLGFRGKVHTTAQKII